MMHRLSFNSFARTIEKKIGDRLGCLYEVRAIKVIKSNGNNLYCLCIGFRHNSIAPAVYLNSYYQEYENGRELDDIIHDILQVYLGSNKISPISVNNIRWDTVKENVILRLVNHDMNKELLQDVPYKIVFDDLAVTFHVLLGSTRDGIESFMINNRLFYSFEIDIEELYISALHNSKAYFMTSIRNINDVMADVVADKGSCNRKRCYDCISLEEGQGAMYVLSNNIGIYGATVLLYSNIVREIAETMNSDIYIFYHPAFMKSYWY